MCSMLCVEPDLTKMLVSVLKKAQPPNEVVTWSHDHMADQHLAGSSLQKGLSVLRPPAAMWRLM